MERLRAFALKGTELARASVGTIRLKLFKLAARVETSTRRVRVRLSEACPARALFAHVFVPLLMTLGVAPEAVLAAYRVADSPVNAITALNAVCATTAWQPHFDMQSWLSATW